ncbi:glycoprotease family protein [Chlamydia pneumoniae LPCoLN]|uniref:N(6)-L-threonylcarbamoyladenine synthase n=1 Tax=Chlamydia pneumoniae TaxID=83558 RepID=A0A0F7WXH8_CHLPN|nr:tRNA (adenosine(37)-N6)-threonylcarbamoyltransferase complex dimerization subunit type 1 TsaB [Chlamydia pneumoniae]ACZ33004.1 glycoprotease family protein [Chlamydia pneumoniae LPCoLN]ETR79896.1 glycoprotease family protein [Chlamydia pneumoniae B21]CRI42158.1 Glycoprotease family protein [Chlamydia pneumoniae]
MYFYKYVIIDTSGYYPFLAYVDNQQVLEHWSLPVGPDLGIVLEFLFKSKNLSFQGVAVALGPGNFSATRIGISFAQGLAMAKNVPLLGYSSLEGYLLSKDEKKALMLPLGKRGGVLTLSSEIPEEGLNEKRRGVGPGALLSYEEASDYCVAHGYYHVISPNPQLFASSFSDKITVEEVAPSVEQIRRHVISQFMFVEYDKQLSPDYRSYSCIF